MAVLIIDANHSTPNKKRSGISKSKGSFFPTSVPWDHSAPKWWRVLLVRPRKEYCHWWSHKLFRTISKHRKHSWSCNHKNKYSKHIPWYAHIYIRIIVYICKKISNHNTQYIVRAHDIGCVLQFYQHEIHLHILSLSLPSDNSRSTASQHTILFHGSEESYCWWKKSQTTTWDVWNPANNVIFDI